MVKKLSLAGLKTESENIKENNKGNYPSKFWGIVGQDMMDKFYKIRFLPPHDKLPNDQLFMKYTFHYGFQGADGNSRYYICTQDSHGTCPMCDEYENRKQQFGKNSEQAKQIKPTTYYFYNILDPSGQPKILRAKPTQHIAINSELTVQLEQWGYDPTDLDNGQAYYLKRLREKPWCQLVAGQTQQGTFERGPVEANIKNNIDNLLHDLTSLYLTNTPEQLMEALRGGDPNGPAIAAMAEQAKNGNNAQPQAVAPIQTQPVATQPAPAPVQTQPVAQAPVVQPQQPVQTTTAPAQLPQAQVPTAVSTPVSVAPVQQPVQTAPAPQPSVPVASTPVQSTGNAELDALKAMMEE